MLGNPLKNLTILVLGLLKRLQRGALNFFFFNFLIGKVVLKPTPFSCGTEMFAMLLTSTEGL